MARKQTADQHTGVPMSERRYEPTDPEAPTPEAPTSDDTAAFPATSAPTEAMPQAMPQTMPTTRIDIEERISESPAAVALPPRPAEPAPVSFPPAEPPSADNGDDDGDGADGGANPGKPRRRWPIVTAIVVVVALIAGVCGAIVYSNKHAEALLRCRTAVSDFSDARKKLVDTTKNLSAVQQWVLDTLGVDGMIDAVADAAGAAEQTVSTEGCAANATITQLNLVADTVSNTTDSLNKSGAEITKQQEKQRDLLGSGDWKKKAMEWLSDSGSDESGDATTDGADSGKTTDDADDDTSAAKRGFKDSLEHAKGLLASVKQQYGDSAAGKRISDGLQSAIDAAEKLDLSPITNSKIYKAAKVTLDEAISTVSNWIDSQAAKAK